MAVRLTFIFDTNESPENVLRDYLIGDLTITPVDLHAETVERP